MKKYKLAFILLSSAVLLPACETIDETRYANVECKDLKQLVAADNLSTLGKPQGTGLYRISSDRENRERRNLFDGLDNDTKRAAELRAAYRNNCK